MSVSSPSAATARSTMPAILSGAERVGMVFQSREWRCGRQQVTGSEGKLRASAVAELQSWMKFPDRLEYAVRSYPVRVGCNGYTCQSGSTAHELSEHRCAMGFSRSDAKGGRQTFVPQFVLLALFVVVAKVPPL